MEEYLRESRLSLRILETEDPGTTISDLAYARRLLRNSGLTHIEQRAVLGPAGAKWETKPIEDALRLLYGDAQTEDRRRGGATPHKTAPRKKWGNQKHRHKT